ncbi:MAG: hypothetical protein O2910_03750 [Proteobacteria bacterium]|nr:hypothetical protein [Pseudomonadota bacterium]
MFSPRHETIITLALEEMASVENRAALIKRTHGVGSTIGALLTQRSIEMMRSYNATVTPVARIADVGPHAGLVDQNGILLLAVPADRIHWTPWFSSALNALSQQTDSNIVSRRIAIAGTASPRAREEARRSNVTLKEDARSSLLPAPEIEWPTPELDIKAEDLPVPGSPIALDGAVTAVGQGAPQQPRPANDEPREKRPPPPALF